MGWIFGIGLLLLIVVSLILIFLVLIQSDKGGGISGAIGGGLANASNIIGAQNTADILTKGTALFAGIYIILCIVLSLFFSKYASKGDTKSILKKRAETESYSPASVLNKGTLPIGAGETKNNEKQDAAPVNSENK